MTAGQLAEAQNRISQWKVKPEPSAVAATNNVGKAQQQNSAIQNFPSKGTPAEIAASFAISTCYDSLDDI
jgi:hypothetical protein